MAWNDRYRENDTPWDKGAPAPPLVELLKCSVEYWANGTVLVPGCGRGHDALAIAQKGYQVVGLDIAPEALKGAKALDEKNLVTYEVGDFLERAGEDGEEVCCIFEHTCFCAIDPSLRSAYMESCARLLPKGGYWVAIIFINPRDVNDPTVGPPFQSSVEEVKRLFGARFELIESYIPQNTFTARKGRERVMVWKKR